jgi:hypothetical protein
LWPCSRASARSALALTTVDYRTVDRDAQRIPDNATGAFYDDFNADPRSSLRSSWTASRPARARISPPQASRPLITVQKVGEDYKASNVEFLP